MKLRERILGFLRQGERKTLLGVGAMSRNTVDATIEIAKEQQIPLMLIASRRQIDSAEFGGGYAERWTTEEFARYVRQRDPERRILLARDHGGPWQHPSELARGLDARAALESAQRSYLADLAAGFDILHIDTSIDPAGATPLATRIDRALTLFDACWTAARSESRDVIFEVGTEEHCQEVQVLPELEQTLGALRRELVPKGIPMPLFTVVQTGTLVKEDRNVGTFERQLRSPAYRAFLREVRAVCEKHQVLIKEHNADYLGDSALRRHPELGIDSANIAPEFGVVETRALLELLRVNRLGKLADEFLTLALRSRRWEKWLLPDTRLDDEGKAILAGHYVFADPAVRALKENAQRSLAAKRIDLDGELRRRVKQAILRYVRSFRLAGRESVLRRAS